MLKQYPGKVKIVFKHFPLRSHRNAEPAAKAAIAAGKQGKFWEFHDALFKNYRQLSSAKFEEIATGLGLDMNTFKQDMQNPEVAIKIRKDLQQGVQLGVRGVPAVYINGRLVKNRSLKSFKQMIDRELSRLGVQ